MTAVAEDNLHLGSIHNDPNGVRDCQLCRGNGVLAGRPCPDCEIRQQLRTAWWRGSSGPLTLRRTIDKMEDYP